MNKHTNTKHKNKNKKTKCTNSCISKNNNNNNNLCNAKFYIPLPALKYQPCNDTLGTNSWFSPGVVECGCNYNCSSVKTYYN